MHGIIWFSFSTPQYTVDLSTFQWQQVTVLFKNTHGSWDLSTNDDLVFFSKAQGSNLRGNQD